MATQPITKQDLLVLKHELLAEMQDLIAAKPAVFTERQWLKSWEVMQILGISMSTLRTMRNKGMLECTKIGGLLFYNYDALQGLIRKNRHPIKVTDLQRR